MSSVHAADGAGRLPVVLAVAGRRAVVIGGGADAGAAAEELVARGADVTVIAPGVSLGVHRLAADGRLTLDSRGYMRGDLVGAALAITSEDDEIARAIADEAHACGCLLWVLGAPELSGFSADWMVERVRGEGTS